MKMKNRLWALLLSVAMVITFLPAAAFADDQTAENSNAAVTEESSAEPVSAVYEGATLRGVVGTNRILSLENPAPAGNRFDVTFSDGSVKEFRWPEEDVLSTGAYPEGAFVYDENTYLYAAVRDDKDYAVSFVKDLNKEVKLELIVHYLENGENRVKNLEVQTDVMCAYSNLPKAIEFVPADGFKLECTAGENYLTDDLFYGEGNQFVVTYEGWNDEIGGYHTYNTRMKYFNDTDANGTAREGFAINGNPDRYGEFFLDDGIVCELGLGEEINAEFSYTEYVDELDSYETVSFTVPVKATKVGAYADWPIYAHNGDPKKPVFKVRDNDGKLIAADAYDVSYEPASNMGWYDAVITFKDKEKYVDSITATYGIGPAAPKITKLIAGKKSLTVKWKKLTKAQLKKVDGFYIELATDKNFTKNYKHIYVSKAKVKSGKKLVKKLKKDKKYYVRIYAYKKITQDGERFKMPSANSKVLSKKTK